MEVRGKMSAKTCSVSFAIMIVLLTSQLSWGATGRISGKVTDATTGEPLPGATVQLVGTSIGAATDLKGNYVIPDVRPGSYTLKASYVGYVELTTKIEVKEGEQLEQDVRLKAVGVTGKEVVVTAQASGQSCAFHLVRYIRTQAQGYGSGHGRMVEGYVQLAEKT